MKTKGISYRDLGDKFGITYQSIQHKLKKKELTLEDINRIGDVLGYDVSIKFVRKGEFSQSSIDLTRERLLCHIQELITQLQDIAEEIK